MWCLCDLGMQMGSHPETIDPALLMLGNRAGQQRNNWPSLPFMSSISCQGEWSVAEPQMGCGLCFGGESRVSTMDIEG
jgi:hypothetical protein